MLPHRGGMAGQRSSRLAKQLSGAAVDGWSSTAVMDLLRPNIEHAVGANAPS
jgi:hypothetical protein